MQAAILKCFPCAQFHFGKLGLDENMSLDDTSKYIHSDTLYSAIINEHNKLYGNDNGETDLFVKAFEANKINISSAFYALTIQGKPTVYFFPSPVTASFLPQKKEVIEQAKKIKKISFVSTGILAKGITPDEWMEPDKCFIIQNEFVCLKEELNALNEKQKQELCIYSFNHEPKVRVHTAVKGDTLYNQANIQIADNDIKKPAVDVNFFFLYYVEDEYKKVFENLIHSILDSGIGGQRSVGSGHFDSVSFEKLSNGFAENSGFFMNLSLIIPESNDLDNFKYYDLITRGGRLIGKGDLRLKRNRMIKEGAILVNNEVGRTEDIRPDGYKMPFIRNGKAFLIPLHKNFNCNE